MNTSTDVNVMLMFGGDLSFFLTAPPKIESIVILDTTLSQVWTT